METLLQAYSMQAFWHDGQVGRMVLLLKDMSVLKYTALLA